MIEVMRGWRRGHERGWMMEVMREGVDNGGHERGGGW